MRVGRGVVSKQESGQTKDQKNSGTVENPHQRAETLTHILVNTVTDLDCQQKN